jgi:hypothetical protein
MALAKAGADVHCKDKAGYGFSGLPPRVVVLQQCGADRPSTRRGAAGGLASAVQEDGAALGVVERPHGDGDGAGQGGRRRALQEQQRVRFSGGLLVSLVCHVAGRTVRPLGVELQE